MASEDVIEERRFLRNAQRILIEQEKEEYIKNVIKCCYSLINLFSFEKVLKLIDIV